MKLKASGQMTYHSDLINILQATPNQWGDPSDALKGIIGGNDKGNVQLLFAFAPKVGGTFLRTVFQHLGTAKNFQSDISRGSYASGNQMRDIYYPSLLAQHLSTYPEKRPGLHLMHLHLLANDPNCRLIELFNIQTIIMRRNLLDTLTSFFDHRERDADLRSEDPILNLGTLYKNLDIQDKKKAIIAFALPWYLQFFITWREYSNYCRNEGLSEPFWTSFGDLKDNPHQIVMKAVEKLDLKMDVREYDVKKAFKKTTEQEDGTVRFNKGVDGRGLEFFSKDEQGDIDRIIDIVGRDAIEAEGLLGYP